MLHQYAFDGTRDDLLFEESASDVKEISNDSSEFLDFNDAG